MVISHENAWKHSRRHIASYIVLWSLGRLFVEHALKESDQPLAKVSTSKPFPGHVAIFTDIHGADDQADVL